MIKIETYEKHKYYFYLSLYYNYMPELRSFQLYFLKISQRE